MTTTWDVYPSMTKADMDKFLVSAFAVKDNPMRVEKSARRPSRPLVDTTTLPRVIATWHRLGKGKYVSARPVAARGLPG